MNWSKEAKTKLLNFTDQLKRELQAEIEKRILIENRDIILAKDVFKPKLVFEKMNSWVHYEVCKGINNCVMAVTSGQEIVDLCKMIADREGLSDFLTEKLQGKPFLVHNQIKIAVATCPNNCVQTQIKDFAVIGQNFPQLVNELCTGCGLCFKSCWEKALTIKDGKVLLQKNICVGCGFCINSCPQNALEKSIGFKVTIGGRLGRRPQLAKTIIDFTDLKTVGSIFFKTINLFKNHYQTGKRFNLLVEKLGIEKIRQEVL